MKDIVPAIQSSHLPRRSATGPRGVLAAVVWPAVLAAACLGNLACEPPPQPPETDVAVKLVLPEGQLAYVPEPPRISIQPHRYISWEFHPAEGDIGTVHPNAVVATSTEGPLQFAVAIDADTPDAPQPTLVRVNTSGDVDFHEAAAIPLRPRSQTQPTAGSYAFGPDVATLQVDGRTIPITLHGEYRRSPGGRRYLKLGLECTLQGLCRFGDRVLAVRIADGDGNGRIGDLVLPMWQGGKLAGRTPGDTVNIDLGDGTFAEGAPLVRAMYGQPVYLDDAWWDVRVSSDRRNVYAHRLREETGRVRIRNAHWEAMFVSPNYVLRQYHDPTAEAFPLPPGRYVVMRYKQWTAPEMTNDKPAMLIEPLFHRNGPFVLKGNEATFEVSAGKTLDLALGTPLRAELTITEQQPHRGHRFSCRVTDASGSTPQYIRTKTGGPVGVTVAVMDHDGAKLSEVPMARAGNMEFDGTWDAPAAARGPFTAVAMVNSGEFAAEEQRTAFGQPPPQAAVEAAIGPESGTDAAGLSAPVKLVEANPSEQTYTWRVDRKASARMVYGVVEDVRAANPKRIVTAYEGSAETGTKDYTLVLTREADKLKVEIQDQHHPPDAGGKGTVWSTMPFPDATELVSVWLATSTDLTNRNYLPLWEGAFLRDGAEVKRITLIARLAAPEDLVTNILGKGDTVRDIVPLPAAQPTDAAALRFLQLAELQARLAAEYAAALEDLGPNHRGTAMLRDLLDQARKERQEVQASLTPQQREQLVRSPQPTGPGVLLRAMQQQLEATEAQLGPDHRKTRDLRRRVEAIRQFMTELDQEVRSGTQGE